MFIGLAWGFIKFHNLSILFHACAKTCMVFFFHETKKKNPDSEIQVCLSDMLGYFFHDFFFFR